MKVDYPALLTADGERLRSIKNEVMRLKTPCGSVVRKRYRLPAHYTREMQRLRLLHAHGLNVPKVLFHQPCVAFLEDLGTQTYVDVLDAHEKESAFLPPFSALLDFLFAFYKATNTLRGDVNLRNFLYRDGICFGVDFEDPPVSGEAERDAGRMLAFVLTYDPAFGANRVGAAHALWSLCLGRGLRAALLWSHMQEEFLRMHRRRKGFAPLLGQATAFRPHWEGLDA